MIRFLTAGESHGKALAGVVEGIPSGLSLTQKAIEHELARRKKGFGVSQRMELEDDSVMIISGVMQGKTTGGPIALSIANKDCSLKPPMTIPRPGHADLTGAIKYGYKDLQFSLERSSARETAMRVCVGAICKAFLHSFGIQVGGYVVQIGNVSQKEDTEILSCFQKIEQAEKSLLRCPFPELEKKMLLEIQKTIEEEDTLGGIFEIVAWNVPPGLGSYVQYDRRLDAQIAFLFMSIPAIKGVEFAHAFENATQKGSAVHDEIFLSEKGELYRKTNRAGGLEGGITTGEPVLVRAAMKPISTIKKGMMSVDLLTRQAHTTLYQRSDVCAVPRAVVVGEAMLAFALSNALIEKLGGDSIEEMKPRYASLCKANIEELNWAAPSLV